MLGSCACDQWHISDEYKTASNESCHNSFLLVIAYDLWSDEFFFSNLGSNEFY
jgi:hypothetical protein